MNSYFWNSLDLPTPVILSCPLNCNNAYVAVSKLRTIMISIKNTLNDLKQLNLEAAALSRLIYRTKYKLRQEKSFKTLQMINRCLTNYLSIHFPFTINSLYDTLADDCGPSRQMMEWTLVRMFTVAHLFHRVHSLCTLAAGHLFVRMKLVQMYEVSFFAVAIVSRIWTLAQFMVRKACQWYGSLYQYLYLLQPSPHPWLPPGTVLPPSLEESLGNTAYLGSKSVSRPDELLSQLDSLVSETDKAKINGNLATIVDLDDIGETIARNPSKKFSAIEEEIEELSLQVSRINKNANSKKRKSQKLYDQVLTKKQGFSTERSFSNSKSETDEARINKDLSKIIDLDESGETVQRVSSEEDCVIEDELEEIPSKVSRISKNAIGKNKKSKQVIHQVLSKKRGLNIQRSSSPVQKNHNTTKTKNNCNDVPKASGISYKHSIKGIKSSEDLLMFLEVESALRKSSSSKEKTSQPFTKNCDKLQWSMMEKFIKKQIKLLSKSETNGDLELKEKLLKRVRKNIKSLVS